MPVTRRPWRSTTVIACLIAFTLNGCGLILGGGDNPRPDDPNVIPPARPNGAASWSGLDWQAVEVERPPKTSGNQWDQTTALAAGPGGWVAVGSNGDVMGYDGRIWQSADSLDWKLVESDLLDGLELVEVAATVEAYVAVGTTSPYINGPAASILRSTDGVTWTEVETIEGAWASSVAAGPQGFAAIIQVDDTTDLLLSSDGRTWTRLLGTDVVEGAWIADIEWDGDGWLAAGSIGDRAVVLRSVDGTAWEEEPLPGSEPVEGLIDVSAYQVVPGRWATLVLGLDRGQSCTENDDWCDQFQVAWSRTAETGWVRLPKTNWLLDRGYGVEVVAAGDAGFLYLLGDEVRTSADGWDWQAVKGTPPSDALATSAVVRDDRVVAVGMGTPVTEDDQPQFLGWFGSALIDLGVP